MYKSGDIINKKYLVQGVCSDSGGMGTVLFVSRVGKTEEEQIVLKYCKMTDEESINRFRREVRLLKEFKGNTRVVQILASNLKHDPPYFVMKYYSEGDLTPLSDRLSQDCELQEEIFSEMIDCIAELHSKNQFHRDIKPQNFLLENGRVVASDFGLSTEIGSQTAFTRSSTWWGTQGYVPPEFLLGEFKTADAAGDVFMLGKTFYALLTKRDPTYIVNDNIPDPLFHLIERCCALEKKRRYQTLAELKQNLTSVYDVLLKRAGSLGNARQLLSTIQDRLAKDHKYKSAEIKAFVDSLAILDDNDQIRLCKEMRSSFFRVIRQDTVIECLDDFLKAYRKMVHRTDYPWEFAETIADNMEIIFEGESVPNPMKGLALELAIYAAAQMNRYAAMRTCKSMVTSVKDEQLGLIVADVVRANSNNFVATIEPSACESEIIRAAVSQIKDKQRSEKT